MSTRAMRRGATTIAAAGTLVLSVAFASAPASGRAVRAALQHHSTSGPTYTLSYSSTQTKAKTNMSLTVLDEVQPTAVTISLPAGFGLNTSAIASCSEAPACEPDTQVGSGSATVVVNGYKIPLNLSLYNAPGGLSLVIQNPNGAPFVKFATWSGSQLMIPYPTSVYTQGNCATKTGGCPIVATQLTLEFNTVGVGSSNYLRTPSTCTSAGWSSAAVFAFSGAASVRQTSVSKCGKWATKPKPKKKK